MIAGVVGIVACESTGKHACWPVAALQLGLWCSSSQKPWNTRPTYVSLLSHPFAFLHRVTKAFLRLCVQESGKPCKIRD
jgi:hypothetical protein